MMSPLKVMTFNIRNGFAADGRDSWEFRREELIEFIKREDPEIVGFQEVLKDQLKSIRAALKDHDFVGIGRDDGIEGGEHCPIFYKSNCLKLVSFGTRWVSLSPDVPGSFGGGARHPRVFTWAEFSLALGKNLLVLNCHLDHEAADARLMGAELMSEFVASRLETESVVMGDFNSASSDEPLSLLTRVARLKEFVPTGPVGTFNEWDAGHLEGEMIDHILASAGVLVKEIRIDRSVRWDPEDQVTRTLSDHFPLIATIEI